MLKGFKNGRIDVYKNIYIEEAIGMFKIAICDDDKKICEDLRNILKQISEINDYEFDISIFNSGEDLYQFFIEKDYEFDMVFLDIELSEKNDGIYIGNAIKNKFFKTTEVVYFSNHTEYALDLFRTHPFDFLVKPPDFRKIENVVMAIIKLINKQNKPFVYKIGNKNYEMDLYKILYFSSHGRKIKIVTLKNNIENNIFYGKLSDIHKLLEKSDFFFIHKSYLVNYHNVSKFEYKKLILTNGKELDITQTYRTKVYEMRMNKIGE